MLCLPVGTKSVNLILIAYSYFTIIVSFLAYLYFDIPMAEYFQERIGNDLWWFFRSITESGEGFYWIVPTGMVYLFYRYVPLQFLPFNSWLRRHRMEDMRIMGFVSLTALLSGLLVNILKLVFARYRPVEYFSDDNYGMNWFLHGYEMASFPSGHSATALGVAAAVALLFPRFRYPVILYGALVTFSRVVINKHYFSDVLVGGFIGVLISVYLYNRFFSVSAFYRQNRSTGK